MQEKAEQQLGMEKEDYEQKFRIFRPDLVKTSMAPAFAPEFLMYVYVC